MSSIGSKCADVTRGGIVSSITFNTLVSDHDYADDKKIISNNDDLLLVSINLQVHLDSMEDLYITIGDLK